MKIETLGRAEIGHTDGFRFYDAQQSGLGSYFMNSLYSDIESLHLHAGLHRKA